MSKIKTFPTLYKKSSTGKIEQWSIWVEMADGSVLLSNTPDTSDHAFVITEYGKLGGKMQLANERVTEGKNLGKANATTALEQACLQAESEWNVKVSRKGYVQDLQKALAGENEGAGGVRPMLAHKYSERGAKYAKFPGYAQPKLDGIRIIAIVKDGKATLWSREQKPIIGLPHIVKQLEQLFALKDVVLDGEAYNHDYKDRFEEIVSFTKQKTAPKDGHEVVQYHVYDVPSAPGTFQARHLALRQLKLMAPLVEVATNVVESETELMNFFGECRQEGYEGAMFRNSGGLYAEGKRSVDLLKVKEYDDAEFEVIGVREGVGKMAGLAVFTAKTPDGQTFDVKLKGKLSDLAVYLKDESTWRGRMLTVQYQGFTAEGKPRFPVGVRWRE